MPQAALLSNEPAGRDLRLLTFDRPAAGHERPGQYAVLTVAGAARPGYFALANDPGDRATFLVKAQGDPAEILAGLPAGGGVDLSEARGAGFPLERGAGRPLILLVNGSGLSAARPVVRAEIRNGLLRPVHLYFGALSRDRIPWPQELEAWRARGVGVTFVLDPSSDDVGTKGYVQDAADAAGTLDGSCAVVLVGVPAMITDVRARFEVRGLDSGLLLTNF